MDHYSLSPKTPLHQQLDDFREEGRYCDVKIQVQNETFSCHRVVLASASQYFDSMFSGGFVENSCEVITLHVTNAVTFKTVIKSIYNGRKPVVDAANFRDLLVTGQFLGVPRIVTKCEDYVLNNLKELSNEVLELFNLACGTSGFLKKKLGEYILQHFRTLVKRDEFLQIPFDCLKFLLKEFQASVPFISENFLLDALIRWSYHSREEREIHLPELIGFVDFSKVTAECENFITSVYYITFRLVKECADGRIMKHVSMKSFDEHIECIDNQMLQLVPFKDPECSEISPTIHLVTENYDEYKGLFWYHLTSLNNNKVEHDWFDSCKFLKLYPLNAFTAVGDYVYCFDVRNVLGIQSFVAHSSVDFSSEPSHVLANFPLIHTNFPSVTTMCGFNNSSLYLLREPKTRLDESPVVGFTLEEYERGFYCYECNVDKWLPVPSRNKELYASCLIADDNLIYLIGGTYGSDNFLQQYIQAYDPRSSSWLTLPNSIYKHNHSVGCTIDGKIYVEDSKHIETYDHTAGRWETILDLEKGGDEENINISCLAPFANKLYIFGRDYSRFAKFATYNPTSRMWSSFTSMKFGWFKSPKIIVFKSLEY